MQEIELPARSLYALQLGVFDQREHAEAENERLMSEGILSMIWQKEKMHIISSVAFEKDMIDLNSAKGKDAYIVKEEMPSIALSIRIERDEIEPVKNLLLAPDRMLTELLQRERTLQSIVLDARILAQGELSRHPENELYTQLAKSMLDWCSLMDDILTRYNASSVRSYAAVTMCALCRELRAALIS